MKQGTMVLRPTTTLDQLLVMIDHISELDGGVFAAQLIRLFEAAKQVAVQYEEPFIDEYGGRTGCCVEVENHGNYHSRECAVATIFHILDPEWSEREINAAFTAAKRMNRARERRKTRTK